MTQTVAALVAANYIASFGNSGDLASARAIFDAMAALGDAEGIRNLRAKASVLLSERGML